MVYGNHKVRMSKKQPPSAKPEAGLPLQHNNGNVGVWRTSKRTDSPPFASNTAVTTEDEGQSSNTVEQEDESDTEEVPPSHSVETRSVPSRRGFDAALAQAMDAVLAPADNDALRLFSEHRLVVFAGILTKASHQCMSLGRTGTN
jgi:hypothetical protein